MLPIERQAKFPKGEKMTVDEVAKVVGPEFKEMNENPPESVKKVRSEMEEAMDDDLLPVERMASFPGKKRPGRGPAEGPDGFYMDVYEGPHVGWEPVNSMVDARHPEMGYAPMSKQEVMRYIRGRKPWRVEEAKGGRAVAFWESEMDEGDADHDAWLARTPRAASASTIQIGSYVMWRGKKALVLDVHGFPPRKVDLRWTVSGTPGSRSEESQSKRGVPVSQIEVLGKRASEQQAEKLEAEAEANEAQADADREKADAARMKEGAGGLYGYTKGTQRDVEASIRKAQRRAASIAKTLYAKDERSVDFLKAHAKRANSKTARLILSAMKSIGPRVAGLHANGARNSLYLDKIDVRKRKDILEAIADHYGTSDMDILAAVTDPDAEALYEYLAFDRGMAMKVYRDFQSGRFASTKTSGLGIEAVKPDLFYVHTEDGDVYGPYRNKIEAGDASDEYYAATERESSPVSGRRVLRDVINPRGFVVNTPAELKRMSRMASAMLPVEKAAAKKTKAPVQEKVAGGLYGYPTKTARLALVACSDLRAYVGEVAYGLHSRRTAKYDKITGFLKEHGKAAKCAYSRMILSCYPDAPVVKAAAMPGAVVQSITNGVSSARAQAGIEAMSGEEAKEKYPWDDCIADQMKQYGDKATAEKVCGKIKAQSQGKSAAVKITDREYDALRPGQRIFMGVSGGFMQSGEKEFEVGRTSYSKKYDVYTKALYPVEDGVPVKKGRAKWKLFKRPTGVTLGHGGMGTVIKSFRTASVSDQLLRKAFVPDSVNGWLEWEDGTRTASVYTEAYDEFFGALAEGEHFDAVLDALRSEIVSWALNSDLEWEGDGQETTEGWFSYRGEDVGVDIEHPVNLYAQGTVTVDIKSLYRSDFGRIIERAGLAEMFKSAPEEIILGLASDMDAIYKERVDFDFEGNAWDFADTTVRGPDGADDVNPASAWVSDEVELEVDDVKAAGPGRIQFRVTKTAPFGAEVPSRRRRRRRRAGITLPVEHKDGTRTAASKTASWKVTVRHRGNQYRDVEDLAEDFKGEVMDSGDDGRGDYSEIHFSKERDSLDFVDAAARKGMNVSKSFRAAATRRRG